MIMYDFLVMRFFRDAGFLTYDYGACVKGFSRIPSTPEFLLSFCVFYVLVGVCVSVLKTFF